MDESKTAQLKQFKLWKRQCLDKEDLSRKGSIDEPIRPLVELINRDEFYYTTSTCSGRISLIEKPRDDSAIKKGGNFLLNCHEELEYDTFYKSINEFREKNLEELCLWLKFEPFIMHVQCFDLDKAHTFLTLALSSGCRNSGITLGKSEKFLVAVRSTSFMEIPLHCGGQFELDQDYLRFLHLECNRRMRTNLIKLGKFESTVRSSMLSEAL